MKLGLWGLGLLLLLAHLGLAQEEAAPVQDQDVDEFKPEVVNDQEAVQFPNEGQDEQEEHENESDSQSSEEGEESSEESSEEVENENEEEAVAEVGGDIDLQEDINLPPPDEEEGGDEEEEENVCSEITILNDASGRFMTPNFPERYPKRSNCSWNITVEEGKRVQLTFHLFNVEQNSNCHWDYVRIFDSNGTLMKHICGYLQQDLVLTSTGNNMFVNFFSDVAVRAAGFLASWTTVEEAVVVEGVDEKPAKEGYVLTMPQTFTTSTEADEEQVCLQLYNVQTEGQVKVSIFEPTELINGTAAVENTFKYSPADENSSGVSCQLMKLPSNIPAGSAIVEVKGDFKDSSYKILSYKSVRALTLDPLVLVQTDKSDYRPKQKVSFRVLLLNYELKPSLVTTVREIWVTDADQARLFQWRDVALKNGVAQLDFDLAEEPAMGSWLIHVKPYQEKDDEITADFLVSENVLPKFEVQVTPPNLVLFDSNETSFKVCSSYTHGGKVKGNANVTFFSEFRANYWRAPPQVLSIEKETNQLVDGCVEVKLNNTEITLLGSKGPIQVRAVVEEAVTGSKQNSTSIVDVKNTALQLQTGSSSTNHIIGGFPYVGKVVAVSHNGQVLANTKLRVCSRLFTDVEEIREYINHNSYKFYAYDEDQYLALADWIQTMKFAETCQDEVTGEDGAFKFNVPLFDVPSNVSKLSIRFSATDHPGNATLSMLESQVKLDVALTHSNSSAALTIFTDDKPRLDCAENKVKVFFAAKPGSSFNISYFVSSGGAILANGFDQVNIGDVSVEDEFVDGSTNIVLGESQKPDDLIVGKHEIVLQRPFLDEGKVAKTIKVLVYTRDEKGNTLSSSRDFEADSCASQPLIQWSAEKVNPSDDVTLSITGNKGAFCGYSVVDKSVDLVPNPNKVTKPRISELKEKIAGQRIVSGQNPTCHNANLLFQAFEEIGLFIMSDSLLIDTKCDNLIDATDRELEEDDIIPMPVAFRDQVAFAAGPIPVRRKQPLAASAAFSADDNFGGEAVFESSVVDSSLADDVFVSENKVELRDYFPETWLFDMIDLDAEGRAKLDLKAPHTITTWIAEVFCSDSESGLEISNATNLVVSQDFFADINMPYSVKRGEILPVNVSIFSSVNRRLPMKLTIKDSNGYKLDQASQSVCLNAEDNQIKTFNLKAQELHEVNITVEAKITDDLEGVECDAAGSAEGYTDVLQKPIQVKPEGFPVEKVQTVFQCYAPEEETKEVKLDGLELPSDLVEGSERAWVSVTGDIMAPALANLDKLVTLPVGCGEQNMITMAPNVYLMNYLNGTGKKDPSLELQAKKYMNTGFKREQTYRHEDGSYSVWGPKQDKVGSMWLTSFVLKVFSQASRFVDIPVHNMQQSLNFMLRNQLKDGCFNVTGYLIHSELAGTDITAAVLNTLLEMKRSPNQFKLPEKVISDALNCVKSTITDDSDVYTKSVAAYALNLYNQVDSVEKEKMADDLLESLITAADTSTPGHLYWNVTNSASRSVEVTAYNVMSMVMADRLPEALKAVRWLATQRNALGGFISTQDTMVALQAMSEYSLKVSQSETDVSLTISEVLDTKHDFNIGKDNLLLLQQEKVTQLPTELQVKVEGSGCFMVQSVLRYNVKESRDKNAFSLTASQLSEILLEICSAYTGNKKHTDMVVIEVELLSGFGIDLQSLEDLQNEVQAPVKKFEYDHDKGTLVLYFDEMPKDMTCWNIATKREMAIDELKPAMVKVYDYYNQEEAFATEYSLDLSR